MGVSAQCLIRTGYKCDHGLWLGKLLGGGGKVARRGQFLLAFKMAGNVWT